MHLKAAVVIYPRGDPRNPHALLGRLRRLGLEAGSLLPWLYPELKKLGYGLRFPLRSQEAQPL